MEIDTGILRPKKEGEFLMDSTPPLPVPFRPGKSIAMAIFKHQYGEDYSTSGISTSFDEAIAIKYAQHNKVIVKLCRKKIKELGVKEIDVSQELPDGHIRYPEDKEVILIFPLDSDFSAISRGIIVERYTLK